MPVPINDEMEAVSISVNPSAAVAHSRRSLGSNKM